MLSVFFCISVNLGTAVKFLSKQVEVTATNYLHTEYFAFSDSSKIPSVLLSIIWVQIVRRSYQQVTKLDWLEIWFTPQ